MDRRSQILAAAAELFAVRGFAAVGVDDIGDAVGITGPAVYRYFRGKDEILRAILADAAENIGDAMASTENDAVAAVEDLSRALVTYALDDAAKLATYQRERHRLEEDAPMRQMEKRVIRIWRTALLALLPDLGFDNLRVRQAAMTGALIGVASRPPAVARPALDELLVRGCVAAVLTPVPPATAEVPARTWTLQRSKRDEILDAALSLVAQHGFHGAGMDDIGEAAGISGPTVYHYYSSKAEILVDAFDRVGERVLAGAEEALRSAHGPVDALERLAASYSDIAAHSTDVITVTAREGLALPEADRPRLSRRRFRLRELWVSVLRELRPELSEAETKLLVRTSFPLVNSAVQAVPGNDHVAEIAAITVSYCLGRETH